MKSASLHSATRDSVLARLMDDYLASCAAGKPPSADELARRYPELRDEVAACLASLEFIQRSAGGAHDSILAVDSADDRRLGDFRVLREVGRGGMGVVYEAEQISLSRRVALKVLPFAAVLDHKQLARFKNEALAAAHLDHPHIVDVLAIGCDRGTHFFAMRYIDGCTLADVIQELRAMSPAATDGTEITTRQAPISPAASTQAVLSTLRLSRTSAPSAIYYRKIADLVATAADGLHHAHEQGIIHRDVKPSNLMLDKAGKLWITDFGLAHIESHATLTMTGDLMGTLRYMSPEQALCQTATITAKSDIYSLGATAYELLALQPLFSGDDRRHLIHKIAFEEPKRLRQVARNVPVELETIIGKAIAKEPESRYATAAEFAADLRRYLGHQPIRARPPGLLDAVTKAARRHALLVMSAAVSLLALSFVLAVAAALLFAERTQKQKALADAQANYEDALLQRREADRFAGQVRQRLYAADMRLAFQSWNRGELQATLEILEHQRPKQDEEDLRGFEWNYLWQLCHSERLTVAAHGGEARSVAYSPDGTRLLTAGEDRIAKIWDRQSGRELCVLRGHAKGVIAAVFSPDGHRIATASDDRTIKLWNANSGELLNTLIGHAAELRCVAFSPDGRWLASGSLDDTARLWDLSSGKTVAILTGHTRGVRGVAFSPDSQQLATAAGDFLVKLWDAETHEERRTLLGNLTWCCGVAFSPDGKTLANCAWGPAIKLWDVTSGHEIQEFVEHTNNVNSVAFHPGGGMLLSASRDSTVRLWDIATQQSIKVLRAHPTHVWCAAFSPDGEEIATVAADGLLKLWDRDAQSSFARLPIDWPSEPEPPGGCYFLTATAGNKLAYFTAYDRELRILDLASGTITGIALDDLDQAAFRCMDLSPDGRLAATGSGSGTVELWDLASGSRVDAVSGHPAFVHSVAFSPDGQFIASGDLSNNGMHQALVYLWHIASGERKSLPYRSAAVRDLAFSPDGQILAAAGDQVQMWRVSDGQPGEELKGHTLGVGVVRFSPDGRLIATGCDDHAVRLWEAATGRLRFTLIGHQGNVGSLAFSPDGQTLASGAGDSTIRLWHVPTGQELTELRGHESESSVVAFCLDGKALASLGTKELFLWPPTEGIGRYRPD